MKAKIVYGVIFGSAFVLVTLIIIFLNSVYNNIFQFDFSPTKVYIQLPSQGAPSDSAVNNEELYQVKQELMDSLMRYRNYLRDDSNYFAIKMDSTVYDSLKSLQGKLANLEKMNKQKIDTVGNHLRTIDSLAAEEKSQKLEEWAKQTAKLYESMDPRKAAKIISSYSDNESREILFRMNKKKAAKILAELNPETAKRITKAL